MLGLKLNHVSKRGHLWQNKINSQGPFVLHTINMIETWLRTPWYNECKGELQTETWSRPDLNCLLWVRFNIKMNQSLKSQYLTHTGKLWYSYCKDFGENWLHYNSTALLIDPNYKGKTFSLVSYFCNVSHEISTGSCNGLAHNQCQVITWDNIDHHFHIIWCH